MTDEQKQKIREYREQGYGYLAIASTLNSTKNQVVGFCHRNNLTGEIGTGKVLNDMDLCRNCGKPLTQPVGKKRIRFCCSECRTKWWNSHPEMVNRKAVYPFTCAHCGSSFTAYGNNHRKYCSHACYIADRFGGDRHDG